MFVMMRHIRFHAICLFSSEVLLPGIQIKIERDREIEREKEKEREREC